MSSEFPDAPDPRKPGPNSADPGSFPQDPDGEVPDSHQADPNRPPALPSATGSSTETGGAIVAPLGPDDERLDPRVVVYWILSGLLSLVILAAVAMGAFFAFRERLPGGFERWIDWGFVLLGLLLLWQFVHPPLNYRRWRYRVDDRLLQVRWGVLVQEEKTIPMSRLQHIDLVRGPVERMFGLATLIVFTAGSEAATFRVPGLRPEQAEALRDQIVSARGADVL